MYGCSYILVLILILVPNIQCACNSFGEIEVEIQNEKGQESIKRLTGCIDPTTVGRHVIRVTVVQEPVPNLKFGAVQNIGRLAEAEFINCSTRTIEPGAYRHLPALERIIITHGLLEELPNEVFSNFPQLDTIKLEHNKIKTIHNHAFANNPRLKQLFLTNNKIESWQSSWLTNSTAVEKLYFSTNQIRELPSNGFKNFRKLVKIWFEFNEISVIHPGAFEGPHNLRYLSLRHNRLTTINPNVFPRRINVESLYLDGNKLNYLSGEIFDRVSMKEIFLDGNPWKCPCLDRINEWMDQKNVSAKHEEYCKNSNVPACVIAQVAGQMCLESVDEEATKYYLESVKTISKNLTNYKPSKCVRLD